MKTFNSILFFIFSSYSLYSQDLKILNRNQFDGFEQILNPGMKEIKLNEDSNKIKNLYDISNDRDSFLLLSRQYGLECLQFEEIYIYIHSLVNFRNFLQERMGNASESFDIGLWDEAIHLVNAHYYKILDTKYVHYDSPGKGKRLFKGLNFYFDNDVFQPFQKNEDRGYTGGGRLEMVTDLFNLRLFDVFFDSRILSYQTIFFGGEAYTPKVQYNEEDVVKFSGIPFVKDPITQKLDENTIYNIKNYLTTNFHIFDRPFASYYYFGRSKHRISYRGKWRLKTEFKLGMIGTDGPVRVQAFLHRDVHVKSKKILLWENQIAQGGRFVGNYNILYDFQIFNLQKNKSSGNFERRRIIYGTLETRIGAEITNLGIGLGYMNRGLHQVSAEGDVPHVSVRKIKGLFSKEKNAGISIFEYWKKYDYLNTDIKMRYIIHNSLLSGIGIFKPFENDISDDDAISVYTIPKKEIEKFVFQASIKYGLRFSHGSVFYQYTILSPEITRKERRIHSFGTIRFNYFIK